MTKWKEKADVVKLSTHNTEYTIRTAEKARLQSRTLSTTKKDMRCFCKSDIRKPALFVVRCLKGFHYDADIWVLYSDSAPQLLNRLYSFTKRNTADA